jgi:hypothetical protein
MFVDTGLTFREIIMNEPLPKGAIQQAIFDFLIANRRRRLRRDGR